MDLTIIIPSYNTRSLLKRCLESIQASLHTSTISVEIIVVDNASTDGSVAMVKKEYPHVLVIANTKNIGYGKANNQAIGEAKGEYVLLLNSDILVMGGAIGALYAFGKSHPLAFIGGKLFNEDKTAQASAGPFYTLPVVFLMLFVKGDTVGITRYSPQTTRPVDWVSGACIIGKKSAFIDVGLFDEQIFMYMEEIDFLYRARQKGYTTLFYPNAHFIHTGAASSSDKKEPVAHIFAGLLYFYRAHRTIMEQQLLIALLRTKALGVLVVARLLGKKTLASIYEKAFRLVY